MVTPMSIDKTRRHESQIAWLTESIELLTRALYLLPSLAAAVALASPVSDLRLPDEDLAEAKTLLGMMGEFSDLRSATGVQPVVVIAFVALLVILGIGVVAAWPGGRRTERARSWLPPATILTTAGIALVLLAYPLALVLDAADHAANSSRNTPFLVQLGGIGMLVLTGVVAVTVAQIHRRAR